MREFIKKKLTDVRSQNLTEFIYNLKRPSGDTITLKGKYTNGISDFVIERTKPNGHTCSSIPVSKMPLTDDCINQIVEIAAENL